MDPVTQGLVGASAAFLFSDSEKARPAALTGALSAMAADLDIFIASPSDPLLNIEMHRQFTHSLLFIPAGALLVSVVLYLFLKKRLNFRQLYIYSFAGFSTAGLLDACTSYGTQLLWPFADTRIAWSVISIFDPLVTAGLILFVVPALIKKKKRFAYMSLGWLTLFLLYGLLQQQRAESAAERLADSRSHSPTEWVVKPTLGNQILWRVNYKQGGKIYTDAIRTGIFSGIRIYEGESSDEVNPQSEYKNIEGTTLYRDLLRFEALSDGYLVRHPERPDVIGDARFSMLPTSITPLWGIEADTTLTGRHAPFLYFRDSGQEVRNEYLRMLTHN
ncbi:metal-dependent hydrolase [Rhodohalobacter mucosus]|uniref:Metal-dependent hydrolase n=1 Tax=Rhodohalobacter mucosus TaxID=2079485 RepID=A0A316TPV8_9BACT|nr:metal-dependent hydrolase [Rhodohalobacter mucosus]PWN05848.1 metal-dependent hydrolase [Rhodohalobacter mucosus]